MLAINVSNLQDYIFVMYIIRLLSVDKSSSSVFGFLGGDVVQYIPVPKLMASKSLVQKSAQCSNSRACACSEVMSCIEHKPNFSGHSQEEKKDNN